MDSRPSLVLRNVSLPGGRTADIAITDGHVSHAGAALPADRTIDCAGHFVLPAAVDMHVHMRGGRQSAKEDWGSGSRSALAGGVTVVVDQPNTVPPLITPDAFRDRVFEAKSGSLCHFAINSGVTHDTPLRAMWSAGAMAFGETFFGPSSYGEAVTPQELTRALGEIGLLNALATIHAEEIAPSAGYRPDAGFITLDFVQPDRLEDADDPPPGGRLTVHLGYRNIADANTVWYRFEIFEGARRRLLREGEEGIPNVKDPDGYWWNDLDLDLDEPVVTEVRVVITDKRSATAYPFTLRRVLTYK